MAPPPPAEAPPEPQTKPAPEIPVHAPLRKLGRRAPTGRPSAASLAGSVVVHLGAIALAAVLFRVGSEVLERSPPPAETVEYFDLAFPEDAGPQVAAAPGAAPGAVQAPAEAPPPAADPGRRREGPAGPAEELQFPVAVPQGLPQPGGAPPAGGGAPGGQPGGTGIGGGGALTPGLRDPRLFPTQRPVPARPERTEHEAYMDRLGTTLGQYNDSIAAEQERARNALDWTLKDKDGNRWGVSPGKVHLGKVTLPAPFGFAASPQAQEASAREGRQRGEIDRQVADRERRDSFQERVKATRERKDAERRTIRGES